MVLEATKSNIFDEFMDELAKRFASKQQGGGFGSKHTSPTGTPTTNYMTGPGGIFGVSGLERDVIATRVAPRGLASTLPALPSIRTNPLYAYLTGFQANTGTNPNGVCDDPMQAGPTKSCIQTAQFGRYSFLTKELEINRIGQQIDRGEFLDIRLLNDPLLRGADGLLNIATVPQNPSLRAEVLMGMLEVGVAFQNLLIQQVYRGNPANNTAGGGYQEFPGLDILIGTDKVDALTGINCPSLDSDIKNFNYGLVDQVSSGTDIVEVITFMYRILRHNADSMGFSPTTWAITMRRELFWEITAIWPCSYLTYRCSFRDATGQERVVVDAGDQIALRDAMRAGSYLLIEGVQIPVIVDDGIDEETDADNVNILAGQFASDIYFIPMTILGGRPVTFWEFFDYSQGPIQATADARVQAYYWTDGGRFLWHTQPPRNWCIRLLSKIEPRIILLTPHLAGRVQNVRYAPLQHSRDPFPADPYFVDGGQTSRTGPSLFSDWNLPA